MNFTVTEQIVIKFFKPYGSFESINNRNIDHNNYAKGGYNVDMAYIAKLCLNSKLLGKTPMLIKYDKLRFTLKTWIGGIERHVTKDDLDALFDRFGVVKRNCFERAVTLLRSGSAAAPEVD